MEKKRRLKRIPDRYYGWVYILPALLLVLLLIGYPLYETVKMSFLDQVLTRPTDGDVFVGFDNYAKIAGETNAGRVFVNTLGFVVLGTGLSFVFGFGMALMINQLSPKWKRFFSGYFLIPYIVPSIVLTLLWMWLFNPSYGIVNHLLSGIGLVSPDASWFTDPFRSPLAILILYVYKSAPFHMLMTYAALQTVNHELYEAVAVDGGRAVHKFWHVTLPSISHVLVVLLSLSAMHCMNFFSPIWLLSEGGPSAASMPISVYLYSVAFRRYDFGYASSIAVLWMLFVGLAAGCGLLIAKRQKRRAEVKKHA